MNQFRNEDCFYGEEFSALRPPPKLVDGPLLAARTAYWIHSLLASILKAVSSSTNRVHTMLWWKGTTYGMESYKSKFHSAKYVRVSNATLRYVHFLQHRSNDGLCTYVTWTTQKFAFMSRMYRTTRHPHFWRHVTKVNVSHKNDIFAYTVTCLTHYYQGSQICYSHRALCNFAASYKW
jgi:hypothetical protein